MYLDYGWNRIDLLISFRAGYAIIGARIIMERTELGLSQSVCLLSSCVAALGTRLEVRLPLLIGLPLLIRLFGGFTIFETSPFPGNSRFSWSRQL